MRSNKLALVVASSLVGPLALVVGCSSSPAAPDPHTGGVIHLAECGYDVTTHDGASRPQTGSSLGPDPTPKFVHLGLPADPSKTIAVLWRTNDEVTMATTVQWGTSGKTDHSTNGFTFVYDLGTGGSVRMHETHLCGLSPDTEYSYRVGGGSAWSPVYTFRTAPAPGTADAQLTAVILGDTRDGYDTWGQTLQAAVQQATPDVILFSGDSVLLGEVQDYWDQWFGAVQSILPSVPLVVAHGNHEANSVNFFSQFAQPGDEQNFALDDGPVHLTVANDTPVQDADLAGANAMLLDKNLQTSAPWSILVNHKPMWSAAQSRHPMDSTEVRMAWQPIVDAHHVDLALEGHDHGYERSLPMRGTTAGMTDADGTTYLRCGSAGAPLDGAGTDYWTAKAESTYSFGIVRARAGQLTVNAFRSDGSALDSVTLTK